MATTSSHSCRSMELLISYHYQPSIAKRNQLVQMNLGLVRKIAHRVSHQCAEPYEDLEQIGYLGLIRAIERFNPAQGCAFSSFAVPYIRGEMLHFLRDRSNAVKIPRRWQELQSEGEKVRQQLMGELGYPPSDRLIAKKLGVTLDEWQQSQVAAKNSSPISLDATFGAQVDVPITLAETLLDPRVLVQQTTEEEHQQLHSALNQLEQNIREVIECVFLKEISRKQVAKNIGVSPMTVTRRLQKGINQLGSLMSPQAA